MKRLRWAALASLAGLLLGGCGGSSTPPFDPTPAITNLFPSNITAGSQDFTLFITGTGFVSTSSEGATFAYWNGSPRSTTLNVITGELEVQISAADVAAANTINVTVVNPGPGGGTSPPAAFTVEVQQNGEPSIASFSPTSAAAGGQAFTLTINGSNFIANDLITWNGSVQTTTFVNANQVTATISATNITDAGSASVSVRTVGLVVGSPSVNFPITGANNPTPSVSSLSPSSAASGSPDLEVTVSGSGFVSSSVVEWGATPLATAFLSSSQLVALVPAADLAMGGSVNVSVMNPAPGGGTSTQTVMFTVK